MNKLPGSYTHGLADKLPKMLRSLERPINSVGRHFQGVSAFDNIVSVEQRAQFPADPAEIVHLRTAVLIEIQAQNSTAATALASQLDIDDLHASHLC